MNLDRFFAANAIAFATHAVTQPIDLVKTRS
jgi:solute carrier family 25 (mitochondrial oxoglutarate transporter), member 11